MNNHKVVNVLMAIFFILAISIPLITVNKTSGKISTSENRALANFPAFTTTDNKLNTHFIKEFESWFNDNLGFRDKFVKANTILQYDMFGKLTKYDTMIGKNNWLYYITPDIIKDYQHLNLLSQQQLIQWGNSLEGINKFLKEKHIPFITMLNLDKKTIYPENYPDSILKVGKVSRTDMLVDYLTKQTNLDFFTPKEALLKAKSQEVVYSPRYDNAHWNNYGAFIGYLELMKRVKNYIPNIKILSWNDFNITRYDRKVDIYNAVSFSENDYAFNLKGKRNAVENRGMLDDINLIYPNLSHRFENNNKQLPKVLILGDSYLYGFLLPDLAESFSELNFIHTDNMDKINNLISLLKPDIVIFENVERSLNHTMDILTKSEENFIDYNNYMNLPVANKPLLYVDYSNNEALQQQGKIVVDKLKKVVNLIGWAIESKVNSSASNIYLKIGDKYYSGTYGISREGVSDYFKNPEVVNCGFNFNIDASELINAGKFSFVVISKDKTYQYAPVEFKVETK
jgi:alginate O-acetyltransferase complex protein AlgJ